jgi:hypothetical protein
VTKKGSKKRSALVVVCLTENERSALEEFALRWDIDLALVVRRLIQYFIKNKPSLPKLLEKYPAPDFADSTAESITQKVSVRLRQEEKQVLNFLAYKAFRLPGETARILVKLYITGVIEDRAIWE